MTPILVACAGVTRAFGAGAAAAVDAVTCAVRADSRIAVTGPSGSGKSTLLHMMAGLDAATAGTVEWPAFGGNPSGRGDVIGVVFQGPSLIPALTVVENVGLPMILAGVGATDAEARAVTALARLGVEPLAAQLPEELSAGQAQRVAIARVLAGAPRLILADEPTGQLDRATADVVVDELLRAASDLGAALVVSTHDPVVAQRLSTQWAMHEGRLELDDDGDLP